MADGTKEDPWLLKTPPGTSEFIMYSDEKADPPALVCQVGSTTLKYRLRAVEDLHAWLRTKTALAAFAEFQAGIKDRCAEGPVAADATVIGSYGLLPL